MFERFTDNARAVVASAQIEAQRLGHSFIGTEHILLSMLEPGRGIAADVLGAAGLTQAAVRAEVERIVGAGGLSEADAQALESIGIDLDAIRAKLEENLGPGVFDQPMPAERRRRFGRPEGGSRPFTARSKKVLELSLREALRLRCKYIGTEHILLGLLREGEGLGVRVIVDAGVSLNDVRERTMRAIQNAAA